MFFKLSIAPQDSRLEKPLFLLVINSTIVQIFQQCNIKLLEDNLELFVEEARETGPVLSRITPSTPSA